MSLSPRLPRSEGGDLVNDVLLENADARRQHCHPEEDVGDARPRVRLAGADAAVPDGEDGHEAGGAFKQLHRCLALRDTLLVSQFSYHLGLGEARGETFLSILALSSSNVNDNFLSQ